MKNLCILTISLWLTGISVRAQDSSAVKTPPLTLTLALTRSSDASYYGQKAEVAAPYVAGVAQLDLRSGFYFTGMAYRLLNDSASVASAGSLGVGYTFKLGAKWKADLHYSHAFYPENSPLLQAASPDNASAAVEYAWWATSGLGVDYNFGKEEDVFVTFSTEKLVKLGSFAAGKDLLAVTPALEIAGGTQHFYETYVTEKRYRDSVLGIPLPAVPLIPGGESGQDVSTVSSSRFDLLSYTLRVPLSYTRSHYMIELAYQVSVLDKRAQVGGGNTNHFVGCSFYYQF